MSSVTSRVEKRLVYSKLVNFFTFIQGRARVLFTLSLDGMATRCDSYARTLLGQDLILIDYERSYILIDCKFPFDRGIFGYNSQLMHI